jgi:hypothetical protein
MATETEYQQMSEAQTSAPPAPAPAPETPPQAHGQGAQPWVQSKYQDPRRKSPLLATILSACPGLGQVYVGYYAQGFINILVVVSLISLLNMGMQDLEPALGFFLAFYWLHNLVDASRRASFYNQALAGVDPNVIPDEMSLPDSSGSLLGGILLVAFGAIAFAHTMFGISAEWVRDWWPLALVGTGGYLIFRSIWARSD